MSRSVVVVAAVVGQQQQEQKQTLLVKTQEHACVRHLEAVLRTVVSFVGQKTETGNSIMEAAYEP